MFGTNGMPSLISILRTIAGLALVAVGLWLVSGAGPSLPPPLGRHGGWFAVAAGVWLIPFLRRR